MKGLARSIGRITSPKLAIPVPLQLPVYTVGTLPAAANFSYCAAIVTDANATTQNSTVAAGGTNKVIVFSDGTNWKIA